MSTENNSKPDESYIGLTANPFKTRYNNHTASFRHEAKRSATELSNYIWDLKEQNIRYSIKWTALGHARPYSAASKRCNLCILEKFYIISKPAMCSLNTRNELVSTCRHSAKFTLSNAITWLSKCFRNTSYVLIFMPAILSQCFVNFTPIYPVHTWS